jgi:hypothetical protein
VAAIWSQAIAGNVIPVSLATRQAAALKLFQAQVAARIVTVAPVVGPSTLGELLSVALGDDQQAHARFADIYIAHRADPKAMWEAVERAFGADVSDRLHIDGQLAQLTVNNAPLVGAVHHAERDKPINAVRDLATRGYYNAKAWSRVLADVPIPVEISGDDDAARRATYASLLAAQIKLMFPNESIAAQIRAGTIPLTSGGERVTQVAAFISEHDDFDLRAEPVARYLARTAQADALPAESVAEISRVQRVYQLTPDDESLSALLSAGVDSAYAITQMGRSQFVALHGESVGGADKAEGIYRRAQTIHAAVLHSAIGYISAKRAPTIGSETSGFIIDPLAGFGG